MKTYPPTPEAIAFMDDLKATLGRHTHLQPMQMLACASQFVGNLIALQDQTKVTPDMAMRLVAANIESGNQQAIIQLVDTKGSA